MEKNKFWEVRAQTNKAELLIYGEISSFLFWGDEVTPKEVNDMLKEIGDVPELDVRINSPGGDVFAGMAIFAMLKRHQAKKTAYIDGLAASIASVIPLACETVKMAKGSMYMIHEAMATVRMARANKLRAQADLLDKINGEITDIYHAKSSIAKDELANLLNAETWYTAEEAHEAGFVDEIDGTLEMAACIKGETAIINGIEVNWKQFANAPILPKVESPPAVDYSFMGNARKRELELISRR